MVMNCFKTCDIVSHRSVCHNLTALSNPTTNKNPSSLKLQRQVLTYGRCLYFTLLFYWVTLKYEFETTIKTQTNKNKKKNPPKTNKQQQQQQQQKTTTTKNNNNNKKTHTQKHTHTHTQ